MKGHSVIDETRELIDNILKTREKDLNKIDDLITAENTAINEANDRMAKATKDGDLKAYQQAKADRANATDAKEMYEARKNNLNNKPLIEKAEYEKIVQSIYSCVAGIESDTKKSLCELSNQMAALASDLDEVANEANAVLKRLQSEIYHDADRTRNPKTGEPLPLSHEIKEVKPYGTVDWGRKAINSAQYKDYTGRRI